MAMMLTFWRRHLLLATPWWFMVFLAVGFVFQSNAEHSFSGLFGTVVAIALWGLVWLVRLGVWVWMEGRTGRVLSRPFLAWSVEPVLVACLGLMLVVQGLVWLRFLPSMPFMTDYAQQCLARPFDPAFEMQPWETIPVSVGLFRVSSSRAVKDKGGRPQLFLVTIRDTPTDVAGFAYVPDGRTPECGFVGRSSSYTHLVGPWWVFRWDV